MKIEFTDQEAMACRQMLEVALKTMGKQAVPAYIMLEQKFEKGAQPKREAADPFSEDDAPAA